MTAPQTKDLARRPDAQNDVVPMEPQLIQGFEGIAAAKFPAEACAVLAEKVDPDRVEIRPDGIVFLPGIWYREQLSRAFGPGGWSVAPRGPVQMLGKEVTWQWALYCLGRYAAEAIGECAHNAKMTHASAAEGAKTDAISRCCKDLGMSSELWDPQWRAWWLSLYAYVDGVDDRGKDRWGRRTNEKVAFFLGRKPAYSPATAQADIDAAKSGDSPNPEFRPDGKPADAARNSSTGVEKPQAEKSPVTPGQLSEIGALVKAIGWSKDESRDWLRKEFATSDWRKLSQGWAGQAITKLKPLAEQAMADEAAAAKKGGKS